jgi:hypothetical protein
LDPDPYAGLCSHRCVRAAFDLEQRSLTDQARERRRKEAEAWAQEQGRKVLAALALLRRLA